MRPTQTREAAYAAASLPARMVFALARLGGAVSALLIVLVLGIVIYAIFQRYGMHTPLLWGDEVIGYLLVAIVMFGAAEALRQEDHISINLVSAGAGPKLAFVLRLWFDLAVLIVAVILGWSTWQAIRFAYDFGSYSAGSIEIATWIPQVPMLIGAGLLGLVAAMRMGESIRRSPIRRKNPR